MAAKDPREQTQLSSPEESLESKITELDPVLDENRRTQMSLKESFNRVAELEAALKQVSSERDDLRRSLEVKIEETEGLYLELDQLERINEETVIELREVKKEQNLLIEEKRERDKKLEVMEEDSSTVVLSVLVAQTDLEERMERKMREVEDISEGRKRDRGKEKWRVVFGMLKRGTRWRWRWRNRRS